MLGFKYLCTDLELLSFKVCLLSHSCLVTGFTLSMRSKISLCNDYLVFDLLFFLCCRTLHGSVTIIRSFLRQGIIIPMTPLLIFKIQQTHEITRTGLGLGRWNPETRVSSARTLVDISTYDSQLPFQPTMLSFIRSKNQVCFTQEGREPRAMAASTL